MKTTRRNFIKVAGLSGAGIIVKGLTSFSKPENEIRFISPLDGDMLNKYDGKVENGWLKTSVKIQASPGSKIKINNIDAKYTDNMYVAEVLLKDYSNIIEVSDGNTGKKQSITIYWLKNYAHKYRLSLDDNIWFLQDISKNSGKYRSIFENPYLAYYKKLHDTYGTKIHINIYYQTDGFNLSQMTTKFKNEWRENAGWLRLSFHALQNDPDNPYIKSGYDEVKRDCDKVNEQIRRFAGEELMGPVTTLHWGEATVEGSRALRDAGYTCQVSDFVIENGVQIISMYLNLEQTKHINGRMIWKDNHEGIIFTQDSMVINTFKIDKIVPYLEELKKDPHKSAYLDLLMHEQYFYPFYKNYQPDYTDKVTTAVKWASEQGYKPAFLHECIYK